MIKAVEVLLDAGERGFGLLFVVGEERNSAGAYKAAKSGRGSRYIINGEPTENKLALGSKGGCWCWAMLRDGSDWHVPTPHVKGTNNTVPLPATASG